MGEKTWGNNQTTTAGTIGLPCYSLSSVPWKIDEFVKYQSVREKLLDISQIYLRGFGLKDEEENHFQPKEQDELEY
jgi:hypothetical protein